MNNLTTVNSVSGGKTSCYMAIHFPADVNIFACVCIDEPKCAPKDPALLRYCLDKLDGKFVASAEHDLTLKVLMDVEQVMGKEIVWVRGKSFDEVIDGAGCLPTWNRRFCTTELKMIPIYEYVYPRYGLVAMNIGYRADEIERIIGAVKNTQIEHPNTCNLYGQFRQKIKTFEWREPLFPLRRTFQYQIIRWWVENHPTVKFPKDSNCRGCHHKPAQLIKQNWLETPEHLEWFALQERKKKSRGHKIATWHDSRVPYSEVFKMQFTEEIDFSNFTMCNSGYCTD